METFCVILWLKHRPWFLRVTVIPSSIALTLKNSILSFQVSRERETGPFFFHKITATIMKTTLQKLTLT